MSRPRRIKWWELAVILAMLVVSGVIILPILARSRESARRASCANNLKQMGLICKMYANEAKGGRMPPMSPIPNNWIVDMNAVYPEYLSHLSVLICPESPFRSERTFCLRRTSQHPHGQIGDMNPDCVSSLFYIYTGYTLTNDMQALALFDAVFGLPRSFVQSDVHVSVPDPDAADDIVRGNLAQSGMPIMWDRVPLFQEEFAHTPLGGNVLYMDGHVMFIPYSYYGATFPITRINAETFGSVLPRLSSDCYDF